jgi:hypothetical protein
MPRDPFRRGRRGQGNPVKGPINRCAMSCGPAIVLWGRAERADGFRKGYPVRAKETSDVTLAAPS